MNTTAANGRVRPLWVYSNKGKFFFNDNIIEDVSTVENDIKGYNKKNLKDTISEIANDSNIFNVNINQKFTVSDEDIKADMYPGVQMRDLTNDDGSEQAQENHNKFITLIS